MGFVMRLYGGEQAHFTHWRVCVCKHMCVCVSASTCTCVCDWFIECVCTIHCSGLSDSLWIGIDFLSSALSLSPSLLASLSPSLPSSFFPLLSLMALYQHQQSKISCLSPLFHSCISLCDRQKSRWHTVVKHFHTPHGWDRMCRENIKYNTSSAEMPIAKITCTPNIWKDNQLMKQIRDRNHDQSFFIILSSKL